MISIAHSGVEVTRQWSIFRLTYALDRLRFALKAYDPDQPRAPGGTEEAGQWISADDDSFTVAGGFTKEELNLTVQDFIAKMCRGGIYGRLPSQFLDYTIKELLAAKQAGVIDASTCYKLLHENRFRK
jgi:hypothetical protein